MSQYRPDLKLKDFRLIQAIAETGQLATASERLGLAQPAASRMLAGIERSLGAKVFHRHPKGMTPTTVGAVLIRNGMELIHGIDQTLLEVEAIGQGRAGRARIGAVTGGAVSVVVPAIQQLKRDAAHAEIHVDVAPSDELVDGLLKGDYDFVLSRVPAGMDARQFVIRRGRVEIVRFLMREGHPASSGMPKTLASLAGYEWVIQAPRTPIRQAVEDAFVGRGVPLPGEIVNTTSLLVMIAYLNTSDAIAPVSREVAELIVSDSGGRRFAAFDLDDPIIISPYHLLSRKGHSLSPLAMKLRSIILGSFSDPGAGLS
ncbi:LysR family transcriptional regulator [Rhodospirillaceae bacterium KN72]|uniref:LysR family transcriptional regulator n=1 Tax=Pacificispira spongiicola TaxID=2729598 RepID=A0A7Y0DY19_9PROT|nr:LysR family transcriptional regulator [Pacificispira spongiicola]NMM43676.1 LysR family transcriptional regulator [Pacificispira spongiicola]